MPKHPHHFAILAIFFSLLSIGLIVVAKVSAKFEGNTGNTTTSSSGSIPAAANNATVASSSNASTTAKDTVTSNGESGSGSGEVEKNASSKAETSKPEACSYTYGSWSACSSSGKQTRTVTSKTPSGCYSSADPILNQSCTYAPPTNQAGACAYTLSDWSSCNSSGTQNREILSRTPVGCNDSNIPNLQRTCAIGSPANVDSSGNTAASKNTSSQNSGVTPAFIFLNINGGEVISGSVKMQGTVNNAQSVEFYLVPTDSNIPKYLGLGKKLDGNVWEYSFDSEKQPNGSYYIRTKIKNAYGSYDGGQRMLILLNAGENSNLVVADSLNNDQENQNTVDSNKEWQKKYFKLDVCVDKNICGGTADPDKDGVNNNDEYRYGTNPANPDSDGDGFLDGDEVKNGYNPLKSSPGDKSDKIIFESPKEKGEINRELYKVNNVEMIQLENGTKKLKISGKGIPNSFVTIYLYSDPIILTVKTNDDGTWSYEVDKDVEDGEHQIYVAVTDNTGKITAKSEPLMFVKTAEAATIIPPAEAAASELASPVENQTRKDIFILLALVVGGLALALASIGLYKHNAFKKEINNQN